MRVSSIGGRNGTDEKPESTPEQSGFVSSVDTAQNGGNPSGKDLFGHPPQEKPATAENASEDDGTHSKKPQAGFSAPPSALFREGMSRVVSAVHIIVTDGPAGRAGFTATAVTAVADTPPTLLVCANASGRTAQALLANKRFSVNTLAGKDKTLAEAFASGRDAQHRFAHGAWVTWPTGTPRLATALTAFDCTLLEARLFTSHHLIIGEVMDVALAREERAEALLYWRRLYKKLTR